MSEGHHFSDKDMYFSHKWKMENFTCLLLELAFFFILTQQKSYQYETVTLLECIGATKSLFNFFG